MKYQRTVNRIVAAILAGFLAGAWCRADSTATSLHLEDADLVPHGNTISCYDVPVTVTAADGTTTTKSYDLELTLSVGADGTLHADHTKMTPAPIVTDTIYHFLPGDYVTISSAGGTMKVTGPVRAPGGRQIWTYVVENVSADGRLNSGSWLSGPVEGNPQLPKDVSLPKNYTFGRDTEQNLIGIQQLGDKLIIASTKYIKDGDSGHYVITGSCILQRKPPAGAN